MDSGPAPSARPGMTAEGGEPQQDARRKGDVVFHGQPHSTHSGFRPLDLIKADHLLSSRSITAACSAGVVGVGSAPSLWSRLLPSWVASATRSSLFSRSMIGCGVPAGATSP